MEPQTLAMLVSRAMGPNTGKRQRRRSATAATLGLFRMRVQRTINSATAPSN
ncbi:MAG: hypothetical protein IPN38_12410 [Flavobacteriales bacterium]|nr:hypothetical protein [Flavobacteriales bacterium]